MVLGSRLAITSSIILLLPITLAVHLRSNERQLQNAGPPRSGAAQAPPYPWWQHPATPSNPIPIPTTPRGSHDQARSPSPTLSASSRRQNGSTSTAPSRSPSPSTTFSRLQLSSPNTGPPSPLTHPLDGAREPRMQRSLSRAVAPPSSPASSGTHIGRGLDSPLQSTSWPPTGSSLAQAHPDAPLNLAAPSQLHLSTAPPQHSAARMTSHDPRPEPPRAGTPFNLPSRRPPYRPPLSTPFSATELSAALRRNNPSSSRRSRDSARPSGSEGSNLAKGSGVNKRSGRKSASQRGSLEEAHIAAAAAEVGSMRRVPSVWRGLEGGSLPGSLEGRMGVEAVRAVRGAARSTESRSTSGLRSREPAAGSGGNSSGGGSGGSSEMEID